MEAELKELKTVLRSLVVSSPSAVDVRTLLHDYRSMMGTTVPVSKYGYRNPTEFLKARCNDCFLFTGSLSNPVLTLIVPDSLKHIDNFVQKQRVPGGSKGKGKRRSVPGPGRSQNNYYSDINSFKTFYSNKDKVDVIKHVQIHEKDTAYQDEKVISSKSDTISNLVKKDQDVPNNLEAAVEDEIKGSSNCSSEVLNNFLKKRLYPYTDSLTSGPERHDGDKTSSKDSGRQTSSSSSSEKLMKLEHLKVEITNLMADYPNGIWCTDFIRLFREKYKKDVNFSCFGYTSIVSLLYMLDDVVGVTRPVDTEDWFVSDARSPVVPAPYCELSPRRASCRPALELNDPDDALPGIHYDPDVFPEDCIHYMESIATMSLQGLEPGVMLEVIVGEVYSPSHLWLIRLGECYHIAMEELMDEMTEYYELGEGRERWLERGAVRVGHHCASVYEGDWHRALIVQLLDADTVKVLHVDYGTVEACASASLRPLLRRWTELPAQALRARLATLRPCANSRQWPRPAAAHLLELVRDRQLVAYIAAVDEAERALEVHLIDTSTEHDVYIGEELERAGHANCVHGQYAPPRSEWHQYPLFEVLESGAAPSYAEVLRYQRDGIELHYVDSYRRHVPFRLTPSPPPSPAHTHSSSASYGFLNETAPNLSAYANESTQQQSGHSEPSTSPQPHLHHSLSLGCQSSQPEVRLSLADCQTFKRLSLEHPASRYCSLSHTISRAIASLTLPANSSMQQHSLQVMQPQLQHPQIHPPPGFDI